jgi:hypothetical protein
MLERVRAMALKLGASIKLTDRWELHGLPFTLNELGFTNLHRGTGRWMRAELLSDIEYVLAIATAAQDERSAQKVAE